MIWFIWFGWGAVYKIARGVKLCRNMHILDCYSFFGGSGRTGERLGEMMLERND